MTNRNPLEAHRKVELERLIVRAREIVKDISYRHLKGMSFAHSTLSIDINDNQTIHINLSENLDILASKIYLEDIISSGIYGHESLDQINILHRFLSLFDLFVEEKKEQTIWKKLFLKESKNSINLFQQAETWWYKSVLSGMISLYCYHDNHHYTFPIPASKLLHIVIPAIYLTDEGVYLLENQSSEKSVTSNDADCQEEILEAIKYLVAHEEVLKAAK